MQQIFLHIYAIQNSNNEKRSPIHNVTKKKQIKAKGPSILQVRYNYWYDKYIMRVAGGKDG